MPSRSRHHPSRPSSTWSWPLAGLCLLLTFGFCAVAGVMLAQLRHEAWLGAQREAENILQTVSADIARNIELYDLSLQAVVDGLKLPGTKDFRPEVRQAILFDRAATAKYLGSILVLDEHGVVIDDAGTIPLRPGTLGDREYFQVHQRSPDLGLFISAPFRRRVTGSGDLVIALSRRLDHADGSFAGVVVGTLRLDYFNDLLGRLDLGKHGAIGLVRTDGIVMARNPFNEAVIGRSIVGGVAMPHFNAAVSGRFRGAAVVDGISRVSNFTHVGNLPLVLSVSFAEADIYAAWNSRAAVIAAVLLGLCAAVAGLGILFSREMGWRARAEQQLRASETLYRQLTDYATDVIARFSQGLTCRYISPSCRAVLGYDPREMVGAAAAASVHPGDWTQLSTAVREAQQKQTHCEVTYRMVHKDGSTVWVEGHFSYLAGDGGFSVVLREVGARKQAEQELEAAYAELTQIAATDALTGIANRRRFDEILAQEWRRAARDEQPLTLLLLDVDRFKLFNDRYGHQEGDACLRAIAQAVAGCAMRPADLVARYGGEEMAVLLPDTDGANAALMGERVRAAVAALALRHEGNDGQGGIVTASIGVATAIPPRSGVSGAEVIANPAALVAAADVMLYEAKRQGRNRVVVHDPSPVLSCVPPWFEAESVS